MRKVGNWPLEGVYAMMAVAGLRLLEQATVSVGAGSAESYQISNTRTRRVVSIHLATGIGDIRIAVNEAATANKLPLIPQRYLVIDADDTDYLSFYNTTGGSITVYVAEVL